MVGEEGSRLIVAGRSGSVLLGTGGGMGRVAPWVVGRRGCPRSVRKLPGTTPQRGLFPGAKGTTSSAVQSGREASGQPRTGRGPSARHRLLFLGEGKFHRVKVARARWGSAQVPSVIDC